MRGICQQSATGLHQRLGQVDGSVNFQTFFLKSAECY